MGGTVGVHVTNEVDRLRNELAESRRRRSTAAAKLKSAANQAAEAVMPPSMIGFGVAACAALPEPKKDTPEKNDPAKDEVEKHRQALVRSRRSRTECLERLKATVDRSIPKLED